MKNFLLSAINTAVYANTLFGRNVQLRRAFKLILPEKLQVSSYTNEGMVQLTVRHHKHNVQCGSTGSLILTWILYELVPSKHNIYQFYTNQSYKIGRWGT
jgi:hypothetical protein